MEQQQKHTHLFFNTVKQVPGLLRDAFKTSPQAALSEKIKRALFISVFLPFFTLLQLVHWLGFFLDALLYPEYSKTSIRRPLFILGPPRSGTTHLHRVLAEDRGQFTTPSTWELFLAPSIIQKKIMHLAAAIDRQLNSPVGQLVSSIERKILHMADDMHPSALQAPEEDYFFMCMTLTCSGLILLFPKSRRLWRYAFFDESVSKQDKRQILAFYKACLQKHLYVSGAHKSLLSKNASFNPWLSDLHQTFPDARFIICARDPVKSVPSMLSVADTARRSFGGAASDPDFQNNMIALMKHHYRSLLNTLPGLTEQQYTVLPIQNLHSRLRDSILHVYKQFNLPLTRNYKNKLDRLDRQSRAYKSGHHYSPDHFGLYLQSLKTDFKFASALLTRFHTCPQTDGSSSTAE
ncbi:MAG: sulfotransferase [candidate division KSB1 bacterium]|nr:sulfotransferase [candidate division KSB1 bacterium]